LVSSFNFLVLIIFLICFLPPLLGDSFSSSSSPFSSESDSPFFFLFLFYNIDFFKNNIHNNVIKHQYSFNSYKYTQRIGLLQGEKLQIFVNLWESNEH
jgi:hypothetical protein